MNEKTPDRPNNRSTWIRLLYIILFLVIFNLVELAIGLIIIVQFFSQLLAGDVNKELQGWGRALAVYVSEIICFLTYHTDEMPFPFKPWASESSERSTDT